MNHSIRGFVSGYVTKRMGLNIESTKSDAGDRTLMKVTSLVYLFICSCAAMFGARPAQAAACTTES